MLSNGFMQTLAYPFWNFENFTKIYLRNNSWFLRTISERGIIQINIEKSKNHSNNGVLSIKFSIATIKGPKIPYIPKIFGIFVLYKTINHPIKKAPNVKPPKARYT